MQYTLVLAYFPSICHAEIFVMPSSTYAHFAECANAISVEKFRSVEFTSPNDSFEYVGQIFNATHQSFGWFNDSFGQFDAIFTKNLDD